MATGNLVTTQGKVITLHRLWKPSPTYTAPTIFDIGTGTNTPALSDVALQTSLTLNKIFVSGYPTLDETNVQSTVRGLVLTTEANGNTITEFGIKNTDATKKLFSRAVFTGITKTASVQIVFVEKDKVS